MGVGAWGRNRVKGWIQHYGARACLAVREEGTRTCTTPGTTSAPGASRWCAACSSDGSRRSPSTLQCEILLRRLSDNWRVGENARCSIFHHNDYTAKQANLWSSSSVAMTMSALLAIGACSSISRSRRSSGGAPATASAAAASSAACGGWPPVHIMWGWANTGALQGRRKQKHPPPVNSNIFAHRASSSTRAAGRPR